MKFLEKISWSSQLEVEISPFPYKRVLASNPPGTYYSCSPWVPHGVPFGVKPIVSQTSSTLGSCCLTPVSGDRLSRFSRRLYGPILTFDRPSGPLVMPLDHVTIHITLSGHVSTYTPSS